MLFQKSIISFIAAIALATIVTAAPQLHDNGKDASKDVGSPKDTGSPKAAGSPTGSQYQGSSQAPSCSSGTPTCCASLVQFSTLSDGDQAALKALDANLDPSLPVGEQCSAAGAQGWYCVAQFPYPLND